MCQKVSCMPFENPRRFGRFNQENTQRYFATRVLVFYEIFNYSEHYPDIIWQENSCGVTKCRLFSQARQTYSIIYFFMCSENVVCSGLLRVERFLSYLPYLTDSCDILLVLMVQIKRNHLCLLNCHRMFLIYFPCFLVVCADVKAYYATSLPFITSQPACHQDVAPSVLEENTMAVTLANEWENEWNQSGLASRLSKEVCGDIVSQLCLCRKLQRIIIDDLTTLEA